MDVILSLFREFGTSLGLLVAIGGLLIYGIYGWSTMSLRGALKLRDSLTETYSVALKDLESLRKMLDSTKQEVYELASSVQQGQLLLKQVRVELELWVKHYPPLKQSIEELIKTIRKHENTN